MQTEVQFVAGKLSARLHNDVGTHTLCQQQGMYKAPQIKSLTLDIPFARLLLYGQVVLAGKTRRTNAATLVPVLFRPETCLFLIKIKLKEKKVKSTCGTWSLRRWCRSILTVGSPGRSRRGLPRSAPSADDIPSSLRPFRFSDLNPKKKKKKSSHLGIFRGSN